MKWIKPSEISSRILTLLDESDERVIIVSPYMKISKLIAKKVGDLTAIKAEIHPGPMPDILQLSGQAQHKLKNTRITGILGAESAYIMEFVRRFMDATDNLVVQEMANSS